LHCNQYQTTMSTRISPPQPNTSRPKITHREGSNPRMGEGGPYSPHRHLRPRTTAPERGAPAECRQPGPRSNLARRDAGTL
jgi:hypothetical protein